MPGFELNTPVLEQKKHIIKYRTYKCRLCTYFVNALHNNLYSPNIIRLMKYGRMIWTGHVERMGNRRGACGVLGEGSSGRDRLEDPGIDGRIILIWGFKKWDGGLYWTNLAQDRDRWRALVDAVMNLRIPQNVRNFLTSWEPVSFSGRTPIRAGTW